MTSLLKLVLWLLTVFTAARNYQLLDNFVFALKQLEHLFMSRAKK